MVSVSFTGASKLPELLIPFVAKEVSQIKADEFFSGGAFGVDTISGLSAMEFFPMSSWHTLVYPKDKFFNEALLELSWDEIIPVSGHYRERNKVLVSLATELHAFPLYPEEDSRSRRSGTWMTVRMAREKGIEVIYHNLWEHSREGYYAKGS